MNKKKDNRKLYFILASIILISTFASAVLLTLLPDTVPLHYDFNGNIDRYGSKYEMLLFPGILLITGCVFIPVALNERKKGERSNEKPILYAAIGTCLPLAALGIYLMAKSINKTEPVNAESIMTFAGIGIGVTLIILGNIIPKTRLNSTIGLRTTWSMKNERVWQKSQRLAGIALVLAGIVSIVLMMFVRGIWSLIALFAATIAAVVVCIIGSYRYYKQDKESETQN